MNTWIPVSERPPFDQQPSRQFIRLEGSCEHSGVKWARSWCGLAFIRPEGSPEAILQYKLEDIMRLCMEGDIDMWTAEVTHWMPAVFPVVPTPEREI